MIAGWSARGDVIASVTHAAIALLFECIPAVSDTARDGIGLRPVSGFTTCEYHDQQRVRGHAWNFSSALWRSRLQAASVLPRCRRDPAVE